MARYHGETWFGYNKYWLMPLIIIVVILSCLVAIPLLFGWTSAESVVKTIASDISGLDRTVVLYGYDGEEIDRWEGNMRVENDDPGEISFIVDGKRTIIEGGIVVIEER